MLVSVSTQAPAGGPGIQYFIGDFDGRTFTTDQTAVLWLDYGPDNYAGTTWDSAPDGRRLYIGWMNNWQYAAQIPTSIWRGAATLPREFWLTRTTDGLRLAQRAPEAFTALRTPLGTWDNLTVSGVLPLDVRGRLLEIVAEFAPGSAERFGLEVHRGESDRARVLYNPRRESLLISRNVPAADLTGGVQMGSFNPVFGAPLALNAQAGETLRLHMFVDESSVEVLAQDGLVALSGQTFVNPAYDGIALFADGGEATLKRLEVYALRSIWAGSTAQASDYAYCQ
jgi:sucrose-6-phosphate hydrolase SacC (GH32 family)